MQPAVAEVSAVVVACDHGSQYIVSKGVTQMLSERIYQFRRKSGLSQEQLAEKIGVSRQAISKWESGTSMPEFQKLLALSECFHITLDELVKDRGAEERTEETRSTPKEAKGPKAHGSESRHLSLPGWRHLSDTIRTHDGHKPRCGRAAEYRFNDHPQWVWCAHRPVRPFDGHWSGPDPAKEMNGGKPMGKLSHLFSCCRNFVVRCHVCRCGIWLS